MSMLGYGGILTTPANTVAVFPLMTMPDLGQYDASLPDGGPGAMQSIRDLSLERIVGQVFRQIGIGQGDVTWGWRLVELPWDFDNGFFDVPWDPGDSVMVDSDFTDMVRWYAERFYRAETPGPLVGVDPLYHPWWTFVDVKPNALVGMHTGVWPGLLIDNTYNEEELWIVHRLRSYGYQR